MKYAKISRSTLTSLASVIRDKSGSSDQLYPHEMASAIRDFPIDPTGGDVTLKYFCETAALSKSEAISSDVTFVGEYAFEGCANLKTVSFPNCLSVGNGAFNACIVLESVNLPNCTNFSWYAFHHCVALKSITLEKCSKAYEYMFASCINLETVSLPALTDISKINDSFDQCYNLMSLYLMGSTYLRPTTSYNSTWFRGTPIAGYWDSSYYHGPAKQYGSIYVPASMLQSYVSDKYWSYWSRRFVGI